MVLNYPPEEIINPPLLERKNYEHIILWMLCNNDKCEWSDFINEPISIHRSTLSNKLIKLKEKDFIEKIKVEIENRKRNIYKITSKGRNKFFELSQASISKRKLSYPPDIIKRKRNYDHIILWMAYNNNFCKWSDYLKEPLSINQSSLSKNMSILLDHGFIRKENEGKNTEYRITKLGKSEYSNMLRLYDLDRQSILDEESKRIKEITQKTIKFFKKYNIEDNEIRFRFLYNVLKLPYEKVKSNLENEEDFYKILLFLSINHPNNYPNYISSKDFSIKYDIEKVILDFHLHQIVEKNIYPIKFFSLNVGNGEIYYFQATERLERMLNAVTEEHIIKFTYLNKLFEELPDDRLTLTIESTVDAILNEICDNLFDKSLKVSLRKFLPEYINYLAYKIEKEKKLIDTYDKLEGLIWQEVQEYNLGEQQAEYSSIQEIDKAINLNPRNLNLYYSKSKILMDAMKFEEVLALLNNMLKDFPEEEIKIQMKRAYVFKEMRNAEAGLDIINELFEKYPKDNDLLNYKALWLEYLDRKEESLETIKNLVKQAPDNATYYDTYGEILMSFGEFEKAIKKFKKAIELGDDWFFFQTYIKLGICYKEIENIKMAIQYLKKGKQLTEKSQTDIDTKQKWLAIVELYMLEISQMKAI